MNEGAVIGLVFLGFIIAFPLLWGFISFLISHLSGWQKLARYYAIGTTDFASPQISWQSLLMGRIVLFTASYTSVVNIGVDKTNLYLSCVWLFRIGHTPLRIPFEEIEITDTNFLFLSVKRLVTKQCPNIKIYMRPGLVRKIEKFAVAAT